MYKKGTVILVPFPFTDLSGNKVRPALIVSKKKAGHDVIVVFITSKSKKKLPHVVSIKPSGESGIKVASDIVCSKIATLDAKIILGELGHLAPVDMKGVENELKKVLDL
ncbi:type II toxin-antitoxin system PemK/MazF family toxin [Candidatus Kaiserbacteria bacterium]|nr:type II toxin-antitoxin system PemK/MazF family toxin [Candidatus Kaiserbacteria bacterium]